ncbi:hypothetical protein CDEST_14409 [Colletotrichum destructivum]|uniref:Uncharacterized protein n=1 Tax=Colletotrichum destructivum TaxID=34406 RepID=A0AAX4J1T6_9PEZI|nr:hypothetical protein CDEST_14409 [Colletotrichum destructivum]
MGKTKDSLKATVVAAGVFILARKMLDSPDRNKRRQPDLEVPIARRAHDTQERRPERRTRRYSRSYTESTSD